MLGRSLKVILFGATGMVGRGVLRECLRDPSVTGVLAIGRSPTGLRDEKLRELIRANLFDVAPSADLRGYDACFFSLGVSATEVSEAEYERLTYDLTVAWAKVLATINAQMTFIYVSGAGTGGKAKWAQVKGRTEAALLEIFPNAFMFRIAALRPVHGEVSKTRWTRVSYAIFRPFLPLIQAIAPNAVITTEELGRAVVRVAREGAPKHILESGDIRRLGHEAG